MTLQPQPTPVTKTDVPVSVRCPKLAAIKAQAKALKKWRKHERTRVFFGWCACLHALGFSF